MLIWSYEESERIEPASVDLNSFKPTQSFYDDIKTVSSIAGVKVHPSFTKPFFADNTQHLESAVLSEKKEEEPTYLNLYKYRLDKISLKCLFHVLPTSTIHTLKFANNAFTHSQLSLLISYLSVPNCPIKTLFFEWNIILNEASKISHDEIDIYPQPKGIEDEESLYAAFIEKCPSIQALFLRSNKIQDGVVLQIAKNLQNSKTLKALDLTANNFTMKGAEALVRSLEVNRSLEMLSLVKDQLDSSIFDLLSGVIGRQPLPADQVDAYHKKIKERDAIIEKNKKLKNAKKPEEPVPYLDPIEQRQDTQDWSVIRNPQFRHINLSMNNFGEESTKKIHKLLSQTAETFSLTLLGLEKVPSIAKQQLTNAYKSRINI